MNTFAALGLLLASAGSLRAQNPSGSVLQSFEVSASYSYVRANSASTGNTSNLEGGSATAAINFRDSLSVVADFGGYDFTGLPSGLSAQMYTYLFGPRFTLHRTHRISPFAQFLVGGGRLNASTATVQAGENAFALAAGGGLDIRLGHHWAIRAPQVEYLMTRFPNSGGTTVTQNNLRISGGLVFRFGSR